MDIFIFIAFGAICAIVIFFGGEKVATIAISILIILFGLKIFINPIFHSFKFDYMFDFTGYNKILGIALIVIGILWIKTEFKKQKK